MASFVLKRLIHAIVVLLGVSIVVFGMVRLTGDPADLFLPESATDEQRHAFRESQGLNDPLVVQYVRFLGHAVTGDFGRSRHLGGDALSLVMERAIPSLVLAALALLLAVSIGVLFGVIGAMNHRGPLDTGMRGIALLSQSMPDFYVGLVLILIFSVNLNLLPTTGSLTPLGLVLPAIALGIPHVAQTLRLVRASLLEELGREYIRTARGKGLSASRIAVRHGLRNALIPVVTSWGLLFGSLFGRSLVTEVIFAYPGMGLLAYRAIVDRDFVVVQAFVIVMAVAIVLLNLLVDLLYVVLDPRISVVENARS